MNDRERIAQLEAKVDQLERDDELSRLRLRDAKAAAKIQSNKIAKLREENERLRGRRSVGFALAVSARMRPFAEALTGLVAILRRRKRSATVSGGSRDAGDVAVPTVRTIDDGGPATFRDHLLGALDDGDQSTKEPLRIAIASADAAQAIRSDLERFGCEVTDLDVAGDGWTSPDESVDVVLVLDHDLDIRRLPRRIVTIAWLGEDALKWLGEPWFDEYDVVISSAGAAADQVRRESAKVATVVDPGASPGPVDPLRAHGVGVLDSLRAARRHRELGRR